MLPPPCLMYNSTHLLLVQRNQLFNSELCFTLGPLLTLKHLNTDQDRILAVYLT